MVPELTQQKQRICTKDASFKVSETDKFKFMHSNALFIHNSKLESNSLHYIRTRYLRYHYIDLPLTKVFDFGMTVNVGSWDLVRESKAHFHQ